MKHALAETLRWVGFLMFLCGVAVLVVGLTPMIVDAAHWVVAHAGFCLTGVLAMVLGPSIFVVGQAISPHIPK